MLGRRAGQLIKMLIDPACQAPHVDEVTGAPHKKLRHGLVFCRANRISIVNEVAKTGQLQKLSPFKHSRSLRDECFHTFLLVPCGETNSTGLGFCLHT